MDKSETLLYFVPTPIGNLKDITLRALEVLKSVDIVYAEDTRKALNLLNHYEIKSIVKSFHKDNEHKVSKSIIEDLLQNKKLAIISEAGTPCISDPGSDIVPLLYKNNISFEVLPGATALIPALIKSGFNMGNFYFHGFMNHKKQEKEKEAKKLLNYNTTIIIYESPHRIKETLRMLFEIFNRPISFSREISKIYEETVFINNENDIENIKEKGEFVIVIDNNILSDNNSFDAIGIINNLIEDNFDKKQIMKIAKIIGLKRNIVYEILEGLEKE